MGPGLLEPCLVASRTVIVLGEYDDTERWRATFFVASEAR